MLKDNPVRMHRPHLLDIPTFHVPVGWHMRTWQVGDDLVWTRLWQTTELFSVITDELFNKEFHGDEIALSQRMLFLCDPQGRVAASAVAWYDDQANIPELGRVHWVAVHPGYQGQGLSKILMTHTLERLRECDHSQAYLMTSTSRLGAIGLYLHFGFFPEIQNEAEANDWRAVLGELRNDHADVLRSRLMGFSL